MPETVIAILDNSGGYNARDPKQATTLLRAMAAWKIDTAHRRFLEVPTEGLSCAMAGIITSDGGF